MTISLASNTTQRDWTAWAHGMAGMLIFSASLPATRVAVAALDPWFVTAGRALIAGLLASAALLMLRAPLPKRRDWRDLIITALGVVVGFPLFSALALRFVASSHALPFIGLLPLATAGFAALIGQDRPRPLFWLFAVLGSALVAGHAWFSGDLTFEAADLLMLAAIVTCGMGYAVGGKLTRRLGSLAVISWALVLSLPVSAVATVALWPADLAMVRASAWAGFAYVSVFSMFVGFLFWYRGLALGGAARVGQLQLLQTFAGLGLAALLLGETVSPSTWAVAAGVAFSVFAARRTA
ncbi:MAG TPA: DMT family transporter [Dongiaceae bacterium]|nr:DMT family transporter [Dongiaceae bacterium]